MKRISLVMTAVLALAALTVQSASKPTGNIKVPANLLLELKVDNKPVAVPSGQEFPFPAGTYAPASITAQAMAAAGKGPADIWTIKSTGPFGSLAQIEVKEGCTSAIGAGPPFTLKATVSKAQNTPQGKTVAINLAVLGKAGEKYAPSTLRKGQTVATPPQLQIVDEKGTILATGGFEYG